MVNRINVTLEELSVIVDLKYYESNTDLWSIPGKTNEMIIIFDHFCHYINVEADKKLIRNNYANKQQK